jgi:hypothetical protein
VTLCVRPEQLTAAARNGRPGPNQIPAELIRAIETPHGMRLEFSNGIAVAMAHGEHERLRDNRDGVIQFPTSSLRVV